MELLTPGEYGRARSLVPSQELAGHMAFVHAGLDGSIGGPVFVDRRGEPRTAVVCSESGFWFALGEANGAAVRALLPELLARHLTPDTALWCTTPHWEAALKGYFRADSQSRRKEFHYRPELALVGGQQLPQELHMQPIDVDAAGRYAPGLDPWVFQVYGGPERFLERSFGWVVMDGERPVASCSACAIGGPAGERIEAETEIGTDEAYRRRGLATAAALRFIDECRGRGLTPAWTCAAGNEASARLARSLGFMEFREVLGFALKPDTVLLR